MTDLFLKVVNMSISATFLVGMVVLLRLALKHAPKWVNVLLWGMVAVRLLCPFTLESGFSLIPDSVSRGEALSGWTDDYVGDVEIIHDNRAEFQEAVEAGRTPLYAGEDGYYVVTAPDSVNAPLTVKNTILPILSIVWCLGMAAMAEYTAFSYWRLRRRVRLAIHVTDNIYLSECIDTPFVLGLLRPRIYLPYHMSEQDSHHVIAHERTHIQRKDHWWKPLGFALLSIHWFNPALWLAYILLCRDIELACDEKVVKELGTEQRADYSQALLNCSVRHRQISACPLAFGEVGVTERVKNVLRYQKPASWVILLAAAVCIVVAVCFLTDPPQPDSLEWLQTLQPDEVEYIEYINEAKEPDKQYALYTGDDMIEAITYLHNFNGTPVREDEVEPVDNSGYQLNISTHSGNHTIRNIGNVYLVIDGDYYKDTDQVLARYFDTFFYGTTYLPATENQELKVSMTVEEVSPTGISIRFENYDLGGELVLFGGNSYFLQTQVDGDWVDLPTLQDPVFTADSYSLSSIRRHQIDWQWLYGTLSDGHYRIGKNVSLYPQDTGMRQSGVVYAEFDISQQTQWTSPYTITSTLSAENARASAEFIANGGGYVFFEEMEVQLVEILRALDENAFIPSVGVDAPHTIITLTAGDTTLELRSDETQVEIAIDAPISGTRWVVTSVPLNNFFAYMNQFSQANSTYEIYNVAPLEELPSHYSMEEASIDKVVIVEDGLVLANSEVWAEFWDEVNHHTPATVRCMEVSEAGRDICDIDFDGAEYHYRTVLDGELLEETYRYLLYFNSDAPENAAYDAFEYFVLVNDNTVTWEDIEWSYLSSQSTDPIDHRIVHRHHIYYPKQPQIPETVQAELVVNGETIGTVTDEQTVHEIWHLINGGEWLGFEPATYFFGPRLMLLAEDGTAYAVDLDMFDDLCRFGDRFYDYGPGMDGEASINNLPKLLALFGLTDWPEHVKELYPQWFE